jgi:hypothetical protein
MLSELNLVATQADQAPAARQRGRARAVVGGGIAAERSREGHRHENKHNALPLVFMILYIS